MRLGITCALAFTAALVLPSVASAAPLDDEAMDSAVVRIWGTGSCTAFLVRPSVFVTAKHCVQHAGKGGALVSRVDIRFAHDDHLTPTYLSMPAAGVRAAPGEYTGDDDIDGHDFGVVESPVPFDERLPAARPLKVFAGDPRTLVGEEVVLLGYGERHASYHLTRVPTRIVDVNRTIIVEPAVSCYGDSGGPLVRVSTGEVVGVASRELPVGIVPCDGSAKAQRSVFQRIDTFATMIDSAFPNAPVDAPAEEADAGCSVGAAHGEGTSAAPLLLLAGLACAVRIRRRASSAGDTDTCARGPLRATPRCSSDSSAS